MISGAPGIIVRTMMSINWFSGFIILLFGIDSSWAGTCTGCVELDDLTFDKLIKKFGTVLVKFDIAYPYGEKHEAYAKFAIQATRQVDDFLVAVVGIKDYGEKENSKLAERFSVGDQYPMIKLFKDGNTNEWVDYPAGKTEKFYTRISRLIFAFTKIPDLDISIENLRQFVRQHSNVYMVLNGCLQQFDDVAAKFIAVVAKAGADSDAVTRILNEAEKLGEQLENEKVSLVETSASKCCSTFFQIIIDSFLL